MAWTAPTTRSTGDLITASNWNTDLVDNLTYLKTETDTKATLTIAETQVFNGTAPTSFTDLDLSGTIGSNEALVLLHISCATSSTNVLVHRNGTSLVSNYYGVTGAAENRVWLWVPTDTAGIIEWRAGVAETTTITLVAYIK